MTIAGVGGAVVLAGAYIRVVRPWHQAWGATNDEVTAHMTGIGDYSGRWLEIFYRPLPVREGARSDPRTEMGTIAFGCLEPLRILAFQCGEVAERLKAAVC